MNIWSWIEDECSRLEHAGRGHLAGLLAAIPDAVCDGHHRHAEGLIEQALAHLSAEQNPWLELFVRHWRLQSRILHRHQVEDNLEECVQLVELASRERFRQCPQAVCTSQNLANGYGLADGPGFADERKALARETLERIDPSWNCFVCISEELASAMIDAAEADEALVFIAGQRCRRIENGHPMATREMNRIAADAHFARGDFAAALRELEAWDRKGYGETGNLEFDLRKSLYLAAAGQLDEARQHWPTNLNIEDHPQLWLTWARARELLVRERPQICEGGTSLRVFEFAEAMRRRGAAWPAAQIQLIGIRMACQGGHRTLVEQARASLQQASTQLRAPAVIIQALEDLEPQIAATDEPRLDFSSEAALLAALPEAAEDALEVAAWGRARWPESPHIAELWCHCLELTGLEDWALQATFSARRAHRNHRPLARRLGRLLLQSGQLVRLESFERELEPDLPHLALWFAGLRHLELGDEGAARRKFEALVKAQPTHLDAREQLARIARQNHDYISQIAHLDHIVSAREPGDADWDRMVAATLLRDWTRLRDSAQRLGIELDGDVGEPAAHSWGICTIRIPGTQRDHDYHALRTGPVTARIIEIAAPGQPQHYGDEVVFDPELLNPKDIDATRDLETARTQPGDESETDDHSEAACYPLVQIRQNGGYGPTHALEGVHPGDACLEALESELAPNIVLEVRSGDEYRVSPDHGPAERGLYAFVAAKTHYRPADLHGRLQRLAREHALAWAWPSLAHAIGDVQLASQMRDSLERMGIVPD